MVGLPHRLFSEVEGMFAGVPRAKAGAAQRVLYSISARYQVWFLERALKDVCSLTHVTYTDVGIHLYENVLKESFFGKAGLKCPSSAPLFLLAFAFLGHLTKDLWEGSVHGPDLGLCSLRT